MSAYLYVKVPSGTASSTQSSGSEGTATISTRLINGSYWEATLTASPASGYSFSGWSNTSSLNATVTYVSQTSSSTVATVVPKGTQSISLTFTASIKKNTTCYLTGSIGTYDSSKFTTASVSPTYQRTLNSWSGGTLQFTLSSTLRSGATFTRWTHSLSSDLQNCVNVSYASQTSANTTAYISYSAPDSNNHSGYITFYPTGGGAPAYSLTVKRNDTSYGSVSGGGTYSQGASVTISATPKSGYVFSHWTTSWSSTSVFSNPYTFTMPGSNSEATAYFKSAPTYAVSTSASPSAGGTLTVEGGPSKTQGSTVRVTATNSTGYAIAGFSVSPGWSGQDLQVDGNVCTFTMPAMNVTVTGTFQKRYTISKVSNPAGAGTVTISGGATASSALQGQNISASATISDPSYLWLGNWTVKDSDGADVPSTVIGKVCKFTMPAKNVTVTANFEGGSPTPTTNYTLSLSSAGNGTVSGGGTYAAGTNVSAQATPSNNYHFVSWTEGGSVVSSVNPYTFTLNSDRSLVANFAQNAAGTSTITVSSGNTSQGTVTGGGTYQQGQSVTITANPKPGYKFVNWTSGGSVVSTSNPYTFTVGTSNQTIVANFAPIVYNIIWDYDGGTADFSDLVYDPLSGGYTLTVDNAGASSGKYTYLYNPLTLAYDFSNYGLNGGSKREFFRCRAPKKTGYTFIGWQITGITDDSGIKKAYYSAEGEESASWHEISGTSFNTSTLPSSQISNPFRYLRTTEGTVTFKALYEYAQGWIPVQVKIRKNGDWEDVPVRMRQTT